jgi:tol-pal system protein YbgF
MKRRIWLQKRFLVLGFILGWGAFILGPTVVMAQSPADWADLNDRLNGLEGRLINMQRGLNRSPQDRVRENIPAQTSASLSLRINSLEGQLRRLTGQMEDLSFRMRRMNDQIKRFTKDAELRFRDIEKGKPGPRITPSPERHSELPPQPLETDRRAGHRPQSDRGPVTPPHLIGPRRSTSRIRIINPGANSSLRKAAPPTSLGRIPVDQLDPDENIAAIDRKNGLNQPFVDEAGALYEKAYEHYLKRKFATAESSFRGFLRRYPRHELAGQAQYWLGETFYARRKYRRSARAFLIGYRKFPKNRRAPETLLKLSMSLRKLGEKAQSCATLDKLAREYPKASSGVKKTASVERRRGRC